MRRIINKIKKKEEEKKDKGIIIVKVKDRIKKEMTTMKNGLSIQRMMMIQKIIRKRK